MLRRIVSSVLVMGGLCAGIALAQSTALSPGSCWVDGWMSRNGGTQGDSTHLR